MIDPVPNIIRQGEGIPLIFIHGMGVDHRILLGLDRVFQDSHCWERIYIDLPGFGDTDPLKGRGGLPDVAQWLNNVVDDLVDGSPFAIVGNSLGGLLARDVVAHHQKQGLGMALLGPVVNPAHRQRTLPERSIIAKDPIFLSSLPSRDAEIFSEVAVIQTAEGWEQFRYSVLPGIRAADRAAMGRISKIYRLPSSPDDRLNGYEGPVLIVTGRQDSVVGFEDQFSLSQGFPHATYVVLNGAGHNMHLNQPHVVHSLLAEWADAVFSYSKR